MKLLQLLENLAQQFVNTIEEVETFLNAYGIKNYTINDDLSVDVDGDVWIIHKRLIVLPVKFGKVGGDFNCFQNNLTSLQGAPREVGGSFNCFQNNLTSLRGAPREVGGSFNCFQNNLTSLRGAPRLVGGDFNCRDNPHLKTLDGIGHVHGRIFADFN